MSFFKIIFFSSIFIIQALCVEDHDTVYYSSEEIEILQNRKYVSEIRYGDSFESMEKLTKASEFHELFNKSVPNQQHIGLAVRNKLLYYLETFSTNQLSPVHLSLLGLPDNGKIAVSSLLSEFLPVYTYNLDRLVNTKDFNDFYNFLISNNIMDDEFPKILVLEGLEKIRETLIKDGKRISVQNPFFSMIKSILLSGGLPHAIELGNPSYRLSNVFIISTIDLPEDVIVKNMQVQIEDELISDKSYFDFFKDMINDSSLKRSVLRDLFQQDSIGVIEKDVVVFNHYEKEHLIEMITFWLKNTMKNFPRRYLHHSGNHYDQYRMTNINDFAHFFYEKYKTEGDGFSSLRTKIIHSFEQVLFFAEKATLSLARIENTNYLFDFSGDVKRKIILSLDNKNQEINIKISSKVDDQKIESKFTMPFFENINMFVIPGNFSTHPPLESFNFESDTIISEADILAKRKSRSATPARGLKKFISSQVFGQDEYLESLEEDLNLFMTENQHLTGRARSHFILKFPGLGIGKIVKLAGQYLELKKIEIDLSDYKNYDPNEVLDQFAQDLNIKIQNVNPESEKILILFKGLEKFDSVNHLGFETDWPILKVLNDLLEKGLFEIHTSESQFKADLRHAFIFSVFELNSSETFLSNDPRESSIENVLSLYGNLSRDPMIITNFLQEKFQGQLSPSVLHTTYFLKPLNKKEHRSIIKQQLKKVLKDRFYDGSENIAMINVKLQESYISYLEKESIIPAENGRNTRIDSYNKISDHLELALKHIPKEYSLEPLELLFSFNKSTNTYIAHVKVRNKKIKILEKKLKLKYPKIESKGKISIQTLETTFHELGHAWAMIRTGQRFIDLTSIPQGNYLGAVSYELKQQSGVDLILGIYSSLASRSFERMLFGKSPGTSLSHLKKKLGVSQDTYDASSDLFHLLYTLGSNPYGGSLSRNSTQTGINFPQISKSEIEKMERILREMEDYIIEDALAAHPIEFYVEKSKLIAKKGTVSEQELYQILGYWPPGIDKDLLKLSATDNQRASLLLDEQILKHFGDVLEDPRSEDTIKASLYKQGNTKTTVKENIDNYVSHFLKILEKQFLTDRCERSMLSSKE
ncbi:MAG: hypothetical protein H6622_04325 [Halobacteriovoraceae bacterium]|nr:hypothetical protein [Halobacteriovoraceae bacterium]